MTQPWHFSVFVGSARQRLADFLAATYKELTTPESFKPNKHEGMSRNAMLAPAVVVVCMKRQVSEKIDELDEIMAVACAVQNMHLTATAYGLGGFWSTNVAATSPAMARFVGLSAKDRAVGVFYLGYPAIQWPKGQRDALEQKVQWFDGQSQ
jgi:nitroreductase